MAQLNPQTNSSKPVHDSTPASTTSDPAAADSGTSTLPNGRELISGGITYLLNQQH